MELDHEKFEGVKELAEISANISMATASLASLQANEREYMKERELRLTERLKKSLVDSSDLIKSIGDNHSALVGYKNELNSFYSTILSLIQDVSECRKSLEKATSEIEVKLAIRDKEILEFKEASHRERTHIQGERTELAAKSAQLEIDRKIIEDQRGTLERAFARLKDKD